MSGSDFGDSDRRFTDEYARERAEERDCDILYATDTTLQLDLDSDDAFARYCDAQRMLGDNGIYIVMNDDVYESRNGNRHVVVHLDQPYPLITRIMLQALLGSDLNRELLAWIGVLKGQEQPILLFRPRR